jgi:hypothetical protein
LGIVTINNFIQTLKLDNMMNSTGKILVRWTGATAGLGQMLNGRVETMKVDL